MMNGSNGAIMVSHAFHSPINSFVFCEYKISTGKLLNKMRAHIISFGLLLACLIVLSEPATVDTRIGMVQGHKTQSGLVEFLGIPYARPPVGKLRFKRPRPMTEFSKTFQASMFGPSCIQHKNREDKNDHNNRQSEDCLTLNIWTKQNYIDDAHTENNETLLRPVIVQIHGGDLISGSSQDVKEASTSFASKGNVVVSLNYRLNVFGFLTLKALSDESPRLLSGNYGLHDCIAALRFIQGNIKNFGGDPKNVVLMGSHTGGSIVYALLSSPLSQDLFAKAIAINGAPRLNSTMTEAGQVWHKQVLENTMCGGKKDSSSKKTVSCLRKLATNDLLYSMPSLNLRKVDKYSISNIFKNGHI